MAAIVLVIVAINELTEKGREVDLINLSFAISETGKMSLHAWQQVYVLLCNILLDAE